MQKLVRDLIPDLMRADGQHPVTQKLTGAALVTALRDKLQEECGEFLRADTPVQRCEELADVLEVIRALAVADGYTMDDVVAAAATKRNKKGGFAEGIFYLGDDTP